MLKAHAKTQKRKLQRKTNVLAASITPEFLFQRLDQRVFNEKGSVMVLRAISMVFRNKSTDNRLNDPESEWDLNNLLNPRSVIPFTCNGFAFLYACGTSRIANLCEKIPSINRILVDTAKLLWSGQGLLHEYFVSRDIYNFSMELAKQNKTLLRYIIHKPAEVLLNVTRFVDQTGFHPMLFANMEILQLELELHSKNAYKETFRLLLLLLQQLSLPFVYKCMFVSNKYFSIKRPVFCWLQSQIECGHECLDYDEILCGFSKQFCCPHEVKSMQCFQDDIKKTRLLHQAIVQKQNELLHEVIRVSPLQRLAASYLCACFTCFKNIKECLVMSFTPVSKPTLSSGKII